MKLQGTGSEVVGLAFSEPTSDAAALGGDGSSEAPPRSDGVAAGDVDLDSFESEPDGLFAAEVAGFAGDVALGFEGD